MKETPTKTIEDDLSSELFDLEEPICKARNYAEALRMIAQSDGLRGESGDAIEMLAQSLILIMRGLEEKRNFLRGLAIQIKGDVPL
jgi:hypothetical protein